MSRSEKSRSAGLGMSNAAIWGDSGVASSFGVVGTVDVGNAFWGKNNDTVNETLYLENDAHVTNGVAPVAARFAGPGSGTYCYIRRNLCDNGTGDLVCTGTSVPLPSHRPAASAVTCHSENSWRRTSPGSA